MLATARKLRVRKFGEEGNQNQDSQENEPANASVRHSVFSSSIMSVLL